jgi:CheY-like chemotaxis protein
VASGYREAQELLERKSVDVVVSDCAMPGRDGVEVLKMAAQIQPDAMRIMHSGNPPADYHLMQRAGLFERLLNKPAHHELMELLDDLVRSWRE